MTQCVEERRACLARLRQRKASKEQVAGDGEQAVDIGTWQDLEMIEDVKCKEVKVCQDFVSDDKVPKVPQRPPVEPSTRQARMQAIFAKRALRTPRVEAVETEQASSGLVVKPSEASAVGQHLPDTSSSCHPGERQQLLASLKSKRAARHQAAAQSDDPFAHTEYCDGDLHLVHRTRHLSDRLDAQCDRSSAQDPNEMEQCDDASRISRRQRIQAMSARCAEREQAARNSTVPLGELLAAAQIQDSTPQRVAKQQQAQRSVQHILLEQIRSNRIDREDVLQELERRTGAAMRETDTRVKACGPSKEREDSLSEENAYALTEVRVKKSKPRPPLIRTDIDDMTQHEQAQNPLPGNAGQVVGQRLDSADKLDDVSQREQVQSRLVLDLAQNANDLSRHEKVQNQLPGHVGQVLGQRFDLADKLDDVSQHEESRLPADLAQNADDMPWHEKVQNQLPGYAGQVVGQRLEDLADKLDDVSQREQVQSRLPADLAENAADMFSHEKEQDQLPGNAGQVVGQRLDSANKLDDASQREQVQSRLPVDLAQNANDLSRHEKVQNQLPGHVGQVLGQRLDLADKLDDVSLREQVRSRLPADLAQNADDMLRHMDESSTVELGMKLIEELSSRGGSTLTLSSDTATSAAFRKSSTSESVLDCFVDLPCKTRLAPDARIDSVPAPLATKEIGDGLSNQSASASSGFHFGLDQYADSFKDREIVSNFGRSDVLLPSNLPAPNFGQTSRESAITSDLFGEDEVQSAPHDSEINILRLESDGEWHYSSNADSRLEHASMFSNRDAPLQQVSEEPGKVQSAPYDSEINILRLESDGEWHYSSNADSVLEHASMFSNRDAPLQQVSEEPGKVQSAPYDSEVNILRLESDGEWHYSSNADSRLERASIFSNTDLPLQQVLEEPDNVQSVPNDSEINILRLESDGEWHYSLNADSRQEHASMFSNTDVPLQPLSEEQIPVFAEPLTEAKTRVETISNELENELDRAQASQESVDMNHITEVLTNRRAVLQKLKEKRAARAHHNRIDTGNIEAASEEQIDLAFKKPPLPKGARNAKASRGDVGRDQVVKLTEDFSHDHTRVIAPTQTRNDVDTSHARRNPEKSAGNVEGERHSRMQRIRELQRQRGLLTDPPPPNGADNEKDCIAARCNDVRESRAHKVDNLETANLRDKGKFVQSVDAVTHDGIGVPDERSVVSKWYKSDNLLDDDQDDRDEITPLKKSIVIGADSIWQDASLPVGFEPEPEIQADVDRWKTFSDMMPKRQSPPTMNSLELKAPKEMVDDLKFRFQRFCKEPDDTAKFCNVPDNDIFAELQRKWTDLRGGMSLKEVRPEFQKLTEPLNVHVDFGINHHKKPSALLGDSTEEEPAKTIRQHGDALFVAPEELPRLLTDGCVADIAPSPRARLARRNASTSPQKSSAVVSLPALQASDKRPVVDVLPKKRQQENCVHQ